MSFIGTTDRSPCPLCDGFDCSGHGTPLDPRERAFQAWGDDFVPDEPRDFGPLEADVWEERFPLNSSRSTRVLVGAKGQMITRSDARRMGLLVDERPEKPKQRTRKRAPRKQ